MFTPAKARRMHASTLLLVLCVFVGPALAHTRPASPASKKPEAATLACAGLRWHADWLNWFPRIVEGCRDVVKVRGQRWARLQALFVRHRDDGAFVSQLLDGKGNLLGGITLLPAVGQGISLKGRRYWFAEVIGEQRLNLYVPEGELAMASQPGAPPEQYALIIRAVGTTAEEMVAAPAAGVDAEPHRSPDSERVPIAASALASARKLRRGESFSPTVLAGTVASMAALVGALFWLYRQPSTRANLTHLKRRYGRSRQAPG